MCVIGGAGGGCDVVATTCLSTRCSPAPPAAHLPFPRPRRPLVQRTYCEGTPSPGRWVHASCPMTAEYGCEGAGGDAAPTPPPRGWTPGISRRRRRRHSRGGRACADRRWGPPATGERPPTDAAGWAPRRGGGGRRAAVGSTEGGMPRPRPAAGSPRRHRRAPAPPAPPRGLGASGRGTGTRQKKKRSRAPVVTGVVMAYRPRRGLPTTARTAAAPLAHPHEPPPARRPQQSRSAGNPPQGPPAVFPHRPPLVASDHVG